MAVTCATCSETRLEYIEPGRYRCPTCGEVFRLEVRWSGTGTLMGLVQVVEVEGNATDD